MFLKKIKIKERFSIYKLKYLALKSVLIFFALSNFSYSQTNCENVKNNELISFLKKEYYENPLEGTKIIILNQCKFLISAGLAPTTSNKLQTMSRIAKIKAERGVSEFLGGSTITSENILETKEVVTENDMKFFESFYDMVKTESASFVNGMETLTAFKSADGLNYIYIIVQTL